MNLYEFEGKNIFKKGGITIPRGVTVHPGGDAGKAYEDLGITEVVVKAQVLSGKRGKNNAIRFCSSKDEVVGAVSDLFDMHVRNQHVAAVHIEEKLAIGQEHYMSITYDTNEKQPVLVYSAEGGMDIEDVAEENITKQLLDIRNESIEVSLGDAQLDEIAQKLWKVFLENDTRLVEINPLVKTEKGEWIAADSKIAIDDNAFLLHAEWK